MFSSILVFLALLACLNIFPTDGQNADSFSCSVAFYPLTACMSDGKRSTFVQFENCSAAETSLTYAWFNTTPVKLKRSTSISRSLPASWNEIAIPKTVRDRGRMIVFYKRNFQGSYNAIQMMIPACKVS